MSQFNYTKKPNWVGDGQFGYNSNDIVATEKGWVYQPTGEVLVAIGGLDAIAADIAVAPTFTATITYSGLAAAVTGDVITVTLTASEAIYVEGSPTIALTIGSATRQMKLDSTTDTTAVFKYTIVAGDSAVATGVTVDTTTTGGYVADVLPQRKRQKATVSFVAPDASAISVN